MLGAATMRPMVDKLLPGANVLSRPRLSTLSFAGEKKITRLPRRSAIVAFSAEEVYAIAELIRRQRGGAAVVLGALSPRTRNAQVALYQSGDVDYLVATDAIGMGLNLDVDHVAFASDRKFDGYQFRKLNPVEFCANRRARRPRDARRHLRHHRALSAVRDRNGAGARSPRFESGRKCCSGATPRSNSPRSARLAATLAADAGGNRGSGARRSRKTCRCSNMPRATRISARGQEGAAGGGAAVGGLPGAGVSEDIAGHPCGTRHHPLWFPDARRRHSGRLVRTPGRAGGQERRRYRYAVEPHRRFTSCCRSSSPRRHRSSLI